MKRTVGDLVWSLTPPARGAMLLTSQLTAWTLRVRPRGDAHARCRPIGHVELTFGRVHFPVDRVRVETVEDPLMREIRYLDKLIDELAKGKAMNKILRGEPQP